MVERLFLAVPQGCQLFIFVVFLDHTNLLLFKLYSFCTKKQVRQNKLGKLRVLCDNCDTIITNNAYNSTELGMW